MTRKIIISLMLLCLILVAVNQVDVDLDPDLKILLARKMPGVAASQNAYFAFVGFYAAADRNMHLMGQRVVDAYVDTGRQNHFNPESVRDAATLNFQETRLEACRKFDASTGYCLHHYREHADLYKALLQQNRILLERYQALLEYRHFRSTEYYIPITPFSVQRLYLARVGSDWLAGRRQQALTGIYADIYFQRMVMSESSLMIYQMISVASLHRDLALLSEFIRQCPQCVINHQQTASLLSNLSDRELLMGRIMESEAVYSHVTSGLERSHASSRYRYYMDSYYQGTVEKSDRNKFVGILAYLTLDNATENLDFEYTKRLIALGGVKGEKFSTLYRKIHNSQSPGKLEWFDIFYNAGGKLLIKKWWRESLIAHEEIYFAVKLKLDCEIRLTRLLLDIKHGRIPDGEISGYLDRLPATDRSPITGGPAGFDGSTQTLFMQVVNDQRAEVTL